MHSRVYFWYHYVMNNFRKYCAFQIHFCSWTPAGGVRVGARFLSKNLAHNMEAFLSKKLTLKMGGQWRSEGGQGGGSCPRAPPEGGRQNPAKDFFKIYIRRTFYNSM